MSLPDFIVQGVSFRDETNPRVSEVWHVRGVVDGMAVCLRWRKSKQRWEYEVLDEGFFSVRSETIKPVRS
jgi:hypothetical protein